MQASLPLPQPSPVPAPYHPSLTFGPLAPLKTVTMQHGLPTAQDACQRFTSQSLARQQQLERPRLCGTSN